MPDYIVMRKGIDSAKEFAVNGGWESWEDFLNKVGITESDCESLWWETTELAPIEFLLRGVMESEAHHEQIEIADVVHGRLEIVKVDSIIWGSKQEVRIVDIEATI
jgi:hypothetical protein